MKRFTIIILAVAAILAGSVSCQKVNDIDKRLTELEQTVSDLKAQVLAGAVITSVDKTDDGCTFTLSNGQSYTVTNGKNGLDGEAIIADVEIEENFIVLTLKNGETLRISYQNPLSMVTLNIIPDFSDGSVYSYSDDGSFFLRVSVKPEKYIDKLLKNDGLVCKADFRSVITKAAEENPDFTVVGEITSASVEEGYMTAYFSLSEEEMGKMWDSAYVVSFSMEDTDGVHGASTSFVPVPWYARKGSGGDERVVEVEGHKVTIRLSDDAADAGIAEDLIVQVKTIESSVIVKTYSDSGKPLVIRNDDMTLVAPVEDGNISTFTISNITSDITSTLAYAKTRAVTVNIQVDKAPNVAGYVYGTADPITVLEGRPSTLTATPGGGYDVDYFEVNGNKYDNQEAVVIPSDVAEICVYFRFSDWLGGVFSVSDTKKVRFSRGNLWCDGTLFGRTQEIPKIKSWGFESNQYGSAPSQNYNREISHISHFMWCKSADESVKLRYSETENTPSDILFTNASATSPSPDFAVNGQKEFWRVLSGSSGGEWEYLINRKDKTLYKYGVTVCGHTNCLILLPDDWVWDAGTVGTDWQEGGYPGTSTEGKVTWKTMESSGAVCLPAAGYRSTMTPSAVKVVRFAGHYGNYWSSTSRGKIQAGYLGFNWESIEPADYGDRDYAYAVRLVTDVK